MFSIYSQRLQLLPLPLSHLQLLQQSRSKLEEALQLHPSNLEIGGPIDFLKEFEDALEHFMLPKVAEHPEEYLWFTHWLIIHRDLNCIIGGIGGTWMPKEEGQVMIGYFIDKKFERQGYATEATQAFTAWIFSQPEVKTIIADTLEGGFDSQRVLQKNGFERFGTTEEGLRWKKSRP